MDKGSMDIVKFPKFVPYNAKIADINESDTDHHVLNLETALSETRKIIAILVNANLITGSGYLLCYPNGHATQSARVQIREYSSMFYVLKDGSQEFEYRQGTANDAFELICFGYVVEV